MKPDIHPDYHKVLFVDTSTGKEWVSRSTLKSDKTKEVDGEELPVIRLEISSDSHPFWTGQQRSMDAEGRVERFNKRYGKKS
jgi:large subunit ribosomal protein L31